MHRDTLNTKYDADMQVKRLVRSMGKTFQKLSANKKFFHFSTAIPLLLAPKLKKRTTTTHPKFPSNLQRRLPGFLSNLLR